MTVRTIKEIHYRLLANHSSSDEAAAEIEGNRNGVDEPARTIEEPTVVHHPVPLTKDAMGRWEVKSIIHQRRMGRIPREV